MASLTTLLQSVFGSSDAGADGGGKDNDNNFRPSGAGETKKITKNAAFGVPSGKVDAPIAQPSSSSEESDVSLIDTNKNVAETSQVALQVMKKLIDDRKVQIPWHEDAEKPGHFKENKKMMTQAFNGFLRDYHRKRGDMLSGSMDTMEFPDFHRDVGKDDDPTAEELEQQFYDFLRDRMPPGGKAIQISDREFVDWQRVNNMQIVHTGPQPSYFHPADDFEFDYHNIDRDAILRKAELEKQRKNRNQQFSSDEDGENGALGALLGGVIGGKSKDKENNQNRSDDKLTSGIRSSSRPSDGKTAQVMHEFQKTFNKKSLGPHDEPFAQD